MADGFFPVWMDPDQYQVFQEPIEKGFKAAGGGKTLDPVRHRARSWPCIMGDDVKACMAPLREHMALYIGGMGAQGQELLHRLRDAARLRRCGAARSRTSTSPARRRRPPAAVPEALVDACHLVGPPARIRDRLQRWTAAGKKGHVGTMLIRPQQPEALELVAEAVL